MRMVQIAGATALALGMALAPTQGHAAGCVKGAVVGGVAGHVAGHHGLLGAGAGCAIGHHEAAKKRDQAQASNDTRTRHDTDR